MQKFRPLACCVFIAVLVFLVFQEVRFQEFLNLDDDINVYNNPMFKPPTWGNLAKFWTEFYFTVYTPLSYTVLGIIAQFAYMPEPMVMADASETHLNASFFHTANLIMHILNALLVFGFMRFLLRSNIAALLSALLFAVHPMQVESVAWVTGWQTVFGGFFALSALWMYCVSIGASVESQEKKSSTEISVERGPATISQSWLWMILATFCFTLALLSKPIFLSVPLVALVLDWGLTQRSWRERVKWLFPWLLLILFFWAINQVGQRENETLEIERIAVAIWQRPFVVGDALTFYLRQLFLPLAFAPDYGRVPVKLVHQPLTYIYWVVPATLLFVAWRKKRIWPVLMAAVGVFFIAVLPTSGIVPYYFHYHSSVADRYVYLAMIGPALFFGWLVTRMPRNLSVPVASLVILALGARSVLQTYVFYNATSFWESALRVNPSSWISTVNVAIVYAAAGQNEKALETSIKAVKLAPKDGKPFHDLALAFMRRKEYNMAMACFKRAIDLNPTYPDTYKHYSRVLVEQGKKEEGLQAALTGFRLDPDNMESLLALGNAQMAAGQYKPAIESYQRLLQIDPTNRWGAKNLASAQTELQKAQKQSVSLQTTIQKDKTDIKARRLLAKNFIGTQQPEKALPILREIVKLEPSDADSHYKIALIEKQRNNLPGAEQSLRAAVRHAPKMDVALVELGVNLAMQNRMKEALPFLQRAVKINSTSALARYNLGGVLQKLGRRDEAIKEWLAILEFNSSFLPARQALARENIVIQ